MNKRTPLIFEQGSPGRIGVNIPDNFCEGTHRSHLPNSFCRGPLLGFPEVSEPEVVRHATRLSRKDYGVDSHMYPLGSCTMKYNPRVNEVIARMREFCELHPETPVAHTQGVLRLYWEMQAMLSEICGMFDFTLAPLAGAHGELTGMKIIKEAIRRRGENRDKVLMPVSAHGTNPASAVLCGFDTIVPVEAGPDGIILPETIAPLVDEHTSALMLTNPNTLGLFEAHVKEISDLLHAKGAYLYGDGANLNALMGITRPGDYGVDVIQLNLHKTFSTPHGGGGPGAGPVGVCEELAPYLPSPRVGWQEDFFGRRQYFWEEPETSIGRISGFYGNFLVILRAYAYILSMGAEGLRAVSENAVLNANYLRALLSEKYSVPDRLCMHEFVMNSARFTKDHKGATMDVAKRLIDLGFHPMTVYFPLCFPEAMLVEPTESETREELDRFVEALLQIEREAKEHPALLHEAPQTSAVRRINDVSANHPKSLDVRWKRKE